MQKKVRCSTIYRIINLVNNKIYIGSTINRPKQRWCVHKSELRHNKHNNSYLQRAWNKYGESNFEFSIVEECSLDVVINREDYWMNFYNSKNRANGYNLISADRHIVSNETKMKISMSNMGRIISEETRKRISESSLGQTKSDTHKANISNGRKGMIFSEKHKQNISKSRLGKKASEEAKIKMCLNSGMRGEHHSEETKLKMSMAAKGRKRSLESIQKQIESSKRNRQQKQNKPSNPEPLNH